MASMTVPARAGSHAPAWDVVLLVPFRLVGFAVVQTLIAGALLVSGTADPWSASALWWPVVATVVNVATWWLLARLLRRQGRTLWDLFRIDTHHIGRDLGAVAAIAVVTAFLVVVPNFALGTMLFGDAEAPLARMVGPLPGWAALTAAVLFPASIVVSELAAYFGYLQPRLEALTGRAWLAVAVAAGSLSLQHATLPLLFDGRFIIWRALMYLPFAVVLGLALRWRPRLLPYLAVVHGFSEVQIALMVATASL
jgi:hypothetical protein